MLRNGALGQVQSRALLGCLGNLRRRGSRCVRAGSRRGRVGTHLVAPLAVLLGSSRGALNGSSLLELLAGGTRASIGSTALTPGGVASALTGGDGSSSSRREGALARPVTEVANLSVVLEVARPLATGLAACVGPLVEVAATLEAPRGLATLAGQLWEGTLAGPVGEVAVRLNTLLGFGKVSMMNVNLGSVDTYEAQRR